MSELLRALADELARDPVALERFRELLAPPPEASSPSVVYTPTTLAAELGRSPRSVRAAIARGELAAVKRGQGWVITADAVKAWTAVPAATARPARRAGRRSRSGAGPMRRALLGQPPAHDS